MKFTVTVFYGDKQESNENGLNSAEANRILHTYDVKTSSIEEIEAIKERKTLKFKNGAGVDSKIVIKKEAEKNGE